MANLLRKHSLLSGYGAPAKFLPSPGWWKGAPNPTYGDFHGNPTYGDFHGNPAWN